MNNTFLLLPLALATLLAVNECDFEVDEDTPSVPDRQIYSTVVDCGSFEIYQETPKKVMYLAGPKRANPFKSIDPDKPVGSETTVGDDSPAQSVQQDKDEPSKKSVKNTTKKKHKKKGGKRKRN